MRNKNLLFVAGLNIDISPADAQSCPRTKFVPWAAFLQRTDGTTEILEQDEVFARLNAQSDNNASQLNLDQSIETMSRQSEVEVRL